MSKGKEVQRDVRLTHGLSVAGRVATPDGEGVEGVELSFKPRRGAALTARTGDDGAYELPGVRSESYEVVVLTEGWFSEQALVARIPKLEPGSVHTFDLQVQGTIAVQGRVLHHDRVPAAGTRVWITGGGRLLRAAHNAGRDLETFSDAQGWWRIHDLPANQGVSVRAALGTLEAQPRGIKTSNLPDKPIELVLAPTVTLKGTVTDLSSRRPVAGARVLIRPRGSPGGRTGRTVTTDAQGTFEALESDPRALGADPLPNGLSHGGGARGGSRGRRRGARGRAPPGPRPGARRHRLEPAGSAAEQRAADHLGHLAHGREGPAHRDHEG